MCRFLHRDRSMSKDSIVFTKVELHNTSDTHLSNTKLMVYLFAIKWRYALGLMNYPNLLLGGQK